MIQLFYRVSTRLGGLKAFKRGMQGGKRTEREILRAWDRTYAKFMHTRFTKFSKGGGNWRRIKKETAKRKGHNRILYELGFLLGAWKPRPGPGGHRRFTRWQVRRGYGGQATYPSGAKIAQVAEIHNEGLGIMPKRQIIVKPDAKTKRKMKKEADRIIQKAARRNRLRRRR